MDSPSNLSRLLSRFDNQSSSFLIAPQIKHLGEGESKSFMFGSSDRKDSLNLMMHLAISDDAGGENDC